MWWLASFSTLQQIFVVVLAPAVSLQHMHALVMSYDA